jgi:hypothetical protein
MVAVWGYKDLRFMAQSPECDEMDDAVAVALEDVSRAARTGIGFSMESPRRPIRLSSDA